MARRNNFTPTYNNKRFKIFQVIFSNYLNSSSLHLQSRTHANLVINGIYCPRLVRFYIQEIFTLKKHERLVLVYGRLNKNKICLLSRLINIKLQRSRHRRSPAKVLKALDNSRRKRWDEAHHQSGSETKIMKASKQFKRQKKALRSEFAIRVAHCELAIVE